MENFLQETLAAIRISGHKESDVMFVGTYDGKYRCSLSEFKKIADFEYDDGYGAQNIPKDLIIYFKDTSYMSRSEYDGSEGWAYNEHLIYNKKDSHKKMKFIEQTRWALYEDTVCDCGAPKDQYEDKCENCLTTHNEAI